MSTFIAGLLPKIFTAVARGDMRPVTGQTRPRTEHVTVAGRLHPGSLPGKADTPSAGA
ncbi:hypothetical protein ABZ424_30735 [Streptomyces sp. NPDC005790]|uniref:hypothetical protein n=1 Tax=Streptomyces sp. NPDC005790 TaxID=3154777 RepID=UPI003409B12A